MQQYYLCNHVHLGLSLHSAILLDLRSGQYLGLKSEQSDALSRLVHGWPSTSKTAEPQEASPTHLDSLTLAQDLQSRGILTADASHGKPATPLALEHVGSSLATEADAPRAELRPHHVYHFLMSSVRAYCALRLWPVGRILKAVRRRKERRIRRRPSASVQDMQALLFIFIRLRPWFYTYRDKCLFDSLVLVEFAARYDMFPIWVLGVKTDPFAAHSWVQYSHYVLNGSPEAVLDYSPIVSA